MLDRLYTDSVAQALDIADAHHWTRQPPRSDRARLRFLTSRNADIAALAARLNTTPKTLQRILTDQPTRPDEELSQAILKEVIQLWQPRIRRRAHRAITDQQHSLWVYFRAWFGFDAAAGSSDDGRMRRLSQPVHHPYPARLLEARRRGAGEEELRGIVADGIGESYFGVSPRPNGLHAVRLTHIDYIAFSY
ncbi:telomere-protecting terminal protein Tpg [Streptomyces murinus]|uniref:telomere-protecting terminal protein Tpg n=1 Tax=Streptomyces murinus TaxID=33900 RepID=UPI003810D325